MSEKRQTKTKPTRPAQRRRRRPARWTCDLLEQIVKLMAANDLNTVDVRDGDRRVILKRGMRRHGCTLPRRSRRRRTRRRRPRAPMASAPRQAAAGDDESKFIPIKSPMVGTFYAAPAKGAKPLVSVGSVVDEETDVCIIEAMKVFNNIKAECRGTIAKILVQDGQPVEFGTTLFLVKPT